MDPSSCILVEDAKVIAQDEPSLDSTIPHTPTEGNLKKMKKKTHLNRKTG